MLCPSNETLSCIVTFTTVKVPEQPSQFCQVVRRTLRCWGAHRLLRAGA